MKLMMIFFSSPSAMMNRYSFTQTSFPVFFFFLLLSPIVLSQQPGNQTATMVKLSHLLPNTSSPWDITKEPDPCQWKGVNCSGSSVTVTHLSFSGFGLSIYAFLPTVCDISSLQSLDLSNNHFSSIPLEVFRKNCGGIISGLKLLNFSKNSLAGPLPDFRIFIGLEHLDLSYNRLNGSVNLQLDELVNLKSLNLSHNHFFGSVPTNLGKSKAIENLELSVNSFTGIIPEEIVDFGNLTLIDLSVNLLTGGIPDRIGELAKLKILILSANSLNGEIPIGLSNISTLTRFAANQNNLGGAIPTGITRFLKNLDISYNKLTGSIPSDLLSYPNLQTVDLSYNLLKGSVPVNVSSSLVRLRLGSNLLKGEMPSATFATLSNLTYLELDNNSFTGMIPRQLGSCQNLTLLNLAQNKLTGSLPVELGNLSNLQVMRFQLNELSGMIPNEFFQLHKLAVMNISWNLLSGPIPSSISNLQKLTNLNLQQNNLRGSIPDSIREMGSLIELQLGENQLSGRIPIMPQKLQIALNLSRNLFQGAIPKTLSGLGGLEVLDLSNNKFSGEIPDFLAREMTSLTQLILSNNQLSGVVPKFDPRVLVNTSGNQGLIQAPPPNSSPQPANRKKWVAVTIVISIAAAVVAIVGVIVIALLISRRFERVNVEQLQLAEESHLPQVTQGSLLTPNAIHKSNINVTKAMEAVANPSNIALKTRFSTYYKVKMPSGMSYFVKKLNWSDKIFQLGSHEKFDKELEVLGKLSNSNVMTPLAYALAGDSAYLFYEYAPKGTLFDVLHGSLGKNGLDWASRYSIAVGVAQGLAFLHGSNSGPILLLDLSSKTILLKSLKEPQVGDIELCKVIDPSKSTGSLSTVAGSVGYIPPEYAYTMRVTPAGNVYSFGVILLELLTGMPAVSEGIELAKWVLRVSAQQDRWDHILDFSVSRVSVMVRSQMLAVLKVAIACVNVSSEARPKMKSVLRMLLHAR